MYEQKPLSWVAPGTGASSLANERTKPLAMTQVDTVKKVLPLMVGSALSMPVSV
jgi:hypothetical protein